MSRPRAKKSPRDALVAIALKLLDRDHPEDLSIRQVAREAGVTSGAPYHHFGDKNGLLAECAKVAWTELCEHLEDLEEDAAIEDALRHKASVYFDYALSNPGRYRLMTSRRLKDDERFDDIASLRMRAMQGLVGLIAEAIGTGADPKQAFRRGMMVWALLHGHVMLLLEGGPPADMVDLLTEETADAAVGLALLPYVDDSNR